MKCVLVLSFLIAGVLCHPTKVIHIGPEPEIGGSCIPKDPEQCGEPKILETSTPVANGTNVCDVKKINSVPVYSYEYEGHCTRRKCILTCESTGHCTSSKNVTKSKISCCEGFTTAQTNTSKEYCSKHTCPQGKPKMETLQQEGCPREILPTVLDCLNQLNLSSLGEAFLGLGFDVEDLNDTISLFAPMMELSRNYIQNEEVAAVLGTHIVKKTIFAAFLEDGDKLETLSEGLFLHISKIKQGEDEEVLFVNGIELTERDACVASNGIVHVIDDFILAESSTITETMAKTEEISIFTFLFEAAGGDKPNMNESTCKLNTLFVPTDEALVEFETLGYVECLLMEQNRKILHQFLKSHISESAHYSSSLVLQEEVEVLSKAKRKLHGHPSNYKPHYHWKKHRNSLQVQVDNNGTILLGSDEAEVIEADIAASNGVIHLISKPLFTSMLNLEKLCTATTAPSTDTTDPATATTDHTEAPTTGTIARMETRNTPTNSRTDILE